MVFLFWLWIYWKRERRFSYSSSISFMTVGAIFVSYLLSVLWAVDRGMAPWGAVKFLPMPLFAVGLMQFSKEKGNRMLYGVQKQEQHMQKAIACNSYSIEEYVDYANMLRVGVRTKLFHSEISCS